LHPDFHESNGLGYRQGRCPNAGLLARHWVNQPTHPSVDEREPAHILDSRRLGLEAGRTVEGSGFALLHSSLPDRRW